MAPHPVSRRTSPTLAGEAPARLRAGGKVGVRARRRHRGPGGIPRLCLLAGLWLTHSLAAAQPAWPLPVLPAPEDVAAALRRAVAFPLPPPPVDSARRAPPVPAAHAPGRPGPVPAGWPVWLAALAWLGRRLPD